MIKSKYWTKIKVGQDTVPICFQGLRSYAGPNSAHGENQGCMHACVRACVCVVCNWYVYVELHSMSSVGVADVCVVCLVCVRWEVPGV